jgi:hypothetical protein
MTFFSATPRGLAMGGDDTDYPFTVTPKEARELKLAERVPLPDGGEAALGADVTARRTLTFECRMRGVSQAAHVALERALAAAWAPSTTDLVLPVTWDGESRLIYGRPVDIDISSDRSRVKNHLSFARCVFQTTSDPIWYLATPQTTSLVTMPVADGGITVASGGIAVASGGITVAAPSGSASDANATNNGTADVDWTARLVGPILNPRITVAGSIVYMSGDLASGSVAIIDSRTHTITVDGYERNWIDPISSRWAKLPAGVATTFSLRGDSGTGTGVLSWFDGIA